MADPSPRLSAKRPTGRNQPKLPLLIQRDRWIPSRSLFPSLFLSLIHRFHHSPLPACKKREYVKETGSFYVRGAILTTTTRYCIRHRNDLLFAFRMLWLNLPSRCSSFTGDWVNRNGERLFFCLQSTVVLSPQHTNHCGGGKDTPLGPTLS